MAYTQKSDHAAMKRTNHTLVLQLIQGRGQVSRKAIAHISGLSPAAVSKITSELIGHGLVHEVGEADARGRAGRREVLLRLNAQAGFVVGVMLTVRAIVCVLTDLDAQVLHVIETPMPGSDEVSQATAPTDPLGMIQATIQSIERLLARTQIDRTRLLGIGVGITGIVDPDTGVSRVAPHFGWRDVPIAAPLAAHFGIPVHLENDVRALTIAEQWFGHGRGVDHFVAVAAGQGIGAGVIANGQLLRGALSGAGEFGHIAFQLDGPPCACGNRGCLEALAAEPAILRLVQDALVHGEPSALAGIEPLTVEAVARAADTGDALAQRSLATAGRWLGVGLTSLVNILNPQLLVIHGETVGAGRWYLEPMEAALRDHVFDGLADSLRIVIAPGGYEVWARGAACVVLSALFTTPLHHHDRAPMRAMRAMVVA